MVSARPPQATTRRVISAKPRVMRAAAELCPKPKSVGDSGGDRDDILQRAAKFDPNYIAVAVNAEGRIAEFLLHRAKQVRILRCDSDRSGIAASDFYCEGWPAERANCVRLFTIPMKHVGDDLGHALRAILLRDLSSH